MTESTTERAESASLLALVEEYGEASEVVGVAGDTERTFNYHRPRAAAARAALVEAMADRSAVFADRIAALEPRAAADGTVVLPGHRGVIYQASSAVYTGRTRARTLWLLPSGEVYSEQAWSKLRRQVRGWRYALDQLVAAGATPWDGREATAAWALRELRRIGRSFRHRGNHRYLIPLSRACRRSLPGHLAAIGLAVQPYPRPAAAIARAA